MISKKIYLEFSMKIFVLGSPIRSLAILWPTSTNTNGRICKTTILGSGTRNGTFPLKTLNENCLRPQHFSPSFGIGEKVLYKNIVAFNVTGTKVSLLKIDIRGLLFIVSQIYLPLKTKQIFKLIHPLIVFSQGF